MRVDVKKFLFVGSHRKKKDFFEEAQKFGNIHFIDLGPQKNKETPLDIEEIIHAIKVLRSLPTIPQEELETMKEAEGVVREILDLKKSLEKLEEEVRIAKIEKSRVEIFGDFSLEDLAVIEKEAHRVVQFFFAKKDHFTAETLPENFIWVGSEHGLDYFIAINKEPVQPDDMIEMVIQQPVGVLKKQIESTTKEIDEKETKLKQLQKYHHFLHQILIEKMNGYHLTEAESQATSELDGSLFAVMGWVPKSKISSLDALTAAHEVAYDEIAVEESDAVPTYLENHGVARIGQDLVGVYDTPSHTDKDPSMWVILSFALFFALIVNDGGYGLIFLLIALWVNHKYNPTKQLGKRLVKLLFILSTSCILWGVMSNSFFSYEFPIDSPMRKVSLLNWLAHKKADYHLENKDVVYDELVKKYPEAAKAQSGNDLLRMGKVGPDGTMQPEVVGQFYGSLLMELALLVGSIHISLSMCRYLRSNWAFIGWIAAIWGAYLYFPTYLEATSVFNYLFGVSKEVAAREGLRLMQGGVIVAVALSFIQNKWSGSMELLNSIQIFSDIMSYLRLYALGLAGGVMGATINGIAANLDPILGAVILLIGHVFNLVLAVMGGVIHGLRLNFLEWYHYSFQGGGKLFRPLCKMETD